MGTDYNVVFHLDLHFPEFRANFGRAEDETHAAKDSGRNRSTAQVEIHKHAHVAYSFHIHRLDIKLR